LNNVYLRRSGDGRVGDRRIDVHHHMLPPVLVDALSAAGVTHVGGEPLNTTWTPQQSLDFMDRFGIATAILSAPTGLPAGAASRATLARQVNEFGHRVVNRWPGQFGFFAVLPLPDIDAAVVEARRALDDLGADGIGLLTNHDGVYQGDARLEPLYQELDRRGAACLVHPTAPWVDGHAAESPLAHVQTSVLEFAFETTRAAANLVVTQTLQRYSRIRYVFTHAGGCVSSLAGRFVDRRPLVAAYSSMLQRGEKPSPAALEEMLEQAQREAADLLATLHYDVALSSDQQALAALSRLVPRTQLVLGTDFPIAQEIGAAVTLKGVHEFRGFTEDDRGAVERTNAARLFSRFSQPSTAPAHNR
jgi:predicted TIM-barrel fold metal-dependent hydrolase